MSNKQEETWRRNMYNIYKFIFGENEFPPPKGDKNDPG